MDLATATPISAEDDVTIIAAEERLVDHCMADEGFDHPAIAAEDLIPLQPGYLSPDELRRSGYQYDWGAEARDQALVAEGLPDPTAGMTDAEVADYERALFGPPDERLEIDDPADDGTIDVGTRGCLAEGRVQLYGTVANAVRWDRSRETLVRQEYAPILREDPDYRDAMDTWTDCMLAAGIDDVIIDESQGEEPIDYGLSILRRRQISSADGATPPSQDEIDEVTAADAGCMEASGLFEVRSRLLPGVEADALARLGLERTELDAFARAVLARAEKVP